MQRIIMVGVVVLSLAAGVLIGLAVPRSPMVVQAAPVQATALTASASLTPFERGQLITQCYQAGGTAVSGTAAPALLPPLVSQCLEKIERIP